MSKSRCAERELSRYVYSASGSPTAYTGNYLTFQAIGEDLYLWGGEKWWKDVGVYGVNSNIYDVASMIWMNHKPDDDGLPFPPYAIIPKKEECCKIKMLESPSSDDFNRHTDPVTGQVKYNRSLKDAWDSPKWKDAIPFSTVEQLSDGMRCSDANQKIEELYLGSHGSSSTLTAGKSVGGPTNIDVTIDGKKSKRKLELNLNSQSKSLWNYVFSSAKFCHPCSIYLEACKLGEGSVPSTIRSISGCDVYYYGVSINNDLEDPRNGRPAKRYISPAPKKVPEPYSGNRPDF
jgi:hypothetical protein